MGCIKQEGASSILAREDTWGPHLKSKWTSALPRIAGHGKKEAQSNPRLRAIVYEQMQARALFPKVPQERACSLEQRKSPRREGPNEDQRSSPKKRRRSNARGTSRAQGREHHNDANSGPATHGQSNNDLPPRRRRPQCSPHRSSRRRCHSPSYSSSSSPSEDKDERRHPRHKIRRSPTPPSSSPSSSSTATSSRSKPKRRCHRRSHPAWKRSRRMEKFKEGGKNITFLSYDGTYGATDRILGFIQ